MFVRRVRHPCDMSTIARGNAAEAMLIARLEHAGVSTLLPFGGGCPFDIAALLPNDRIVRIQVKSGRVRSGCVRWNTHATDHGRGPLHYRGRADYFGIFVESIDRCFMVPVDDCPLREGSLRLVPTRNNQRLRIRLADDYSFERWAAGMEQPRAVA
jgi:hypothetical protein